MDQKFVIEWISFRDTNDLGLLQFFLGFILILTLQQNNRQQNRKRQDLQCLSGF